MKCPYCGKEMEEGYIKSMRRIVFCHKKPYVFSFSDEDEQLLSTNNLTTPNHHAWRCQSCKKIIIDYDKQDKEATL